MDEKIICLAQSDVENKLPLADPVWIRSLFLKGVRADQNVADNHSKSARICRYPRGSRANVNIIVRKNGSARIRSLPGLVRSEPFLAVTQMLTILSNLKKPLGS
jgi:hypothetical protein